tara:strand:+ start:469 stop:633 length:165 start_codon:yes stop_codon:yes gene_type:complete
MSEVVNPVVLSKPKNTGSMEFLERLGNGPKIGLNKYVSPCCLNIKLKTTMKKIF